MNGLKIIKRADCARTLNVIYSRRFVSSENRLSPALITALNMVPFN